MSLSHRRWRRGSLAALAAASLVAGGAGVATSVVDTPAADAVTQPVAPTQTPEVERISGAERYETAAAVAAEYPEGADVVYVASGADFADALAARDHSGATPGDAPLGDNLWVEGQDGGPAAPVLLVTETRVPTATRAALTDLDPSTIIIVGGEASVSDEVGTDLEEYADEVERLSGADRYQTAAAVADRWEPGHSVVFLASGTNAPDALTGGAVATRANAPILLTRPNHLPGATAAALTALAPSSVVIVGGTGAVDQTVEDAVAAIVPDTRRVGGVDRYETAELLAERYERDLDRVFVATGGDYPDALTGSALAGFEGAPLLLSKPEQAPTSTDTALNRLSPQGIAVLGGEAAVSADVVAGLEEHLAGWAEQMTVQLLSFNDFHGHLEAGDNTLNEVQDPEQHIVGGVEYLSTTLSALRIGSLDDQTLTVAAGDLIGGSTFLSGMFHDEPTVEALDAVGLDISSVGNHEFDEGTDELLRMQHGGCHPVDGCYFEDKPYAGADFNWLSANVVDKETEEPLLPGTEVREIDGVKVGFIGMTLEDTPSLVSPGGVATVDFLNEVETANAEAAKLDEAGVKAIVVLLHEGGYQAGTYESCEGPSGPIVEIAENFDATIDMVVTGHTHQPYLCNIPDPDGNPRMVTSAAQYGYVVTETDLVIDRTTGEVDREAVLAQNHLVLQDTKDDLLTQLLAPWIALSEEVAGEVVGTITEDITGDAGGDRGIETPMANLVADSILWGTADEADGGAQIAFMNVGGVRASLIYDEISNDEEPGEITYEEAYNVAPFGNLLVSVDLTGDQVKAVLEQQYIPDRGRQYLALGVSEGFSYTWDDEQPEGEKVSGMELDGVPLEGDEVYRVATLNFLAEGGDDFTAFTEGTNLTGGPEDLANLVDYFGANPDLSAPGDRVIGL